MKKFTCAADIGDWRKAVKEALEIKANRFAYSELGRNRTLMMNRGAIVLDIKGKEREGLTVNDLLEKFRAGAGKNLDNDRILLS